jgi:hypothetical protein
VASRQAVKRTASRSLADKNAKFYAPNRVARHIAGFPNVFKRNTATSQTYCLQNLDIMADSTVEEINNLFAAPGAELEADVSGELQSILRLHSIPPQELFYKWESYSMKMGSDDLKLNIETARALKKDVQDSLERENRSKAHVRTTDKRGGATPRNVSHNGDVFGM